MKNNNNIDKLNNFILSILLYVDDQVLISRSENLKEGMYKLGKIIKMYNLTISAKKTKLLISKGNIIRRKIIHNNNQFSKVMFFII